MRFNIVTGAAFHNLLTESKRLNIKYGSGLDVKSAYYYDKNCVCFISCIGGLPCGYAIEGGQTLINVFKNPEIKEKAAYRIITHAIGNGAKFLDCFATIRWIYETFGFVTYHKEKFNPALIQVDYNVQLLGTPDIHYMRLTN